MKVVVKTDMETIPSNCIMCNFKICKYNMNDDYVEKRPSICPLDLMGSKAEAEYLGFTEAKRDGEIAYLDSQIKMLKTCINIKE